ncbi:hypothetical protein [Kitasatospora sp. NPDC059571]|uniref:hypothetical protein n=1 Tax=Kitasatospora sp. NPDC059571 TaxID=3346871 RepID=UPI0036BBDF86
MRGVRGAVAVLVAAVVVAGCGRVVAGSGTGPAGGGAPGVSASAGGVTGDAARLRAAEVARAWPGSAVQRQWTSGYYPLDVPPEWLPRDAFHSGADKAAYAAGHLDLRGGLPQTLSGTAQVRFADGSVLAVPLVSADAVFRRLTDTGVACPGACAGRLEVSGARPATREVSTSRGRAVIPVWEFSVAGYAEPFTYPAVAGGQVPGEPSPGPRWEAPGAGAALWSGTSADGLVLTGLVTHGACTQLLPGEVYETDAAVVLIARWRSTAVAGQACPASAVVAPQEFRLARPLGGRAVLDLVTGGPQAQAGPGRMPTHGE